MSDTSIAASNDARRGRHGKKRKKRRRSSDKEKPKPILHHNHYRTGSVISSYTAINAPTGLPPKTTPFRHCKPKHGGRNEEYLQQNHSGNKRIELVIKQVAPVYPVSSPPQQYVYTPALPSPEQQRYVYTSAAPPVHHRETPKEAAYIVERDRYIERDRERERGVQEPDRDRGRERRVRQEEPIYVPPPMARKYETFQHNEEEKRSVRFGVDRRRMGRAIQPQQRVSNEKKESLTEGTGTSMLTVEPMKVSEGTRMGQSVFQVVPKKVTQGTVMSQSMLKVEPKKMTEGTGASMNTFEMNHLQVEPFSPRQRERILANNQIYTNYDGPIEPRQVDNFQVRSPTTTTSVLAEVEGESVVEVKDVDLCPLCHKGWYVRKFTWSGIIAAIFCFPCGIIPCFKMRVYVCSFCGEQPMGEFAGYKEENMPKTPGEIDDSQSRIVPPQRPSDWRMRA